MYNYLALLCNVLNLGEKRTNERTGVGTAALFGAYLEFDLSVGFPLMTTKKVYFKSVVAELLWMLSGSTNVKDLQALGCGIWDQWADENGDLGPIYQKQWLDWGGINQFDTAINKIKTNPESRDILVSAWNVPDLESMALKPCHTFFQLFCHNNGELSMQMYQRSADIFIGVPFNIAQYSLLLHMIARATARTPRFLRIVYGDVHLYSNHVDQANEQLDRIPRSPPDLEFLTSNVNLYEYNVSDICVKNYHPHPAIKAPVAK